MNHLWSWIFILHVLFCHTALAISGNELVTPSHDPENISNTAFNSTIATTIPPARSKRLVGPIVGGVLGGLVLIGLLGAFIYICIRRHKASQLEDGPDPDASSRKWFSRFGRFRRDNDPLSSPLPQHMEKPSPIPRYLRQFGRKRPAVGAIPVDRPLPPAPAVPKSARFLPGNTNSIVMSLPSPSPGKTSEFATSDAFPPTDRGNRRKIQVAPQPVVIGHPFKELPERKPRRRPNFPNLFQLDSKGLPVPLDLATPQEITQKMQEALDAVAELEEKSRLHFNQVHSGVLPHGEPRSCQIDLKYEQDIAELRQEVRYLEGLLSPNVGTPRVAHSSKW